MRTLRSVVLGAVCAVVGYLGGVRWGLPFMGEEVAETTPSPPAARSEPRPQVTPVPALDGCAALQRRVRELELAAEQARSTSTGLLAELSEARALQEEAVAQREAAQNDPRQRPLPFPDNAPEAFKPDGFRKVVEKSLKECDQGLALEAIDCSEFPCIAWTKAKNLETSRYSMGGCAAWKEQFGMMTGSAAASFPLPGGGDERYVAFYPMPQDPEVRKVALFRVRERTQAMIDTFRKR